MAGDGAVALVGAGLEFAERQCVDAARLQVVALHTQFADGDVVLDGAGVHDVKGHVAGWSAELAVDREFTERDVERA